LKNYKLPKKVIEKALEDSIKKWEKIVKSCKFIDKASANCPLCKLYFRCHYFDEECIVMRATGHDGCRKSPYKKWIRHQENSHTDKFSSNYYRRKNCKICLKLAIEELNFLKSLRKKLI